MSGDGIFSLGLVGPLILLFLGHVLIGLLSSGTAIVLRLRASSELTARKSQSKVSWAIATLIGSELLSILGGRLLHWDIRLGARLLVVGLFLVWPVSGVLTIFGKGPGRRVMLVGHSVILLWIVLIFLLIWAHGDWSQLRDLVIPIVV